MRTGEACNRSVVVVSRNTTLSEASKLMRQHHVGSLVVLDDEARKPVGIVTDRDIVVEVLAADLDYRTVGAGEIMSPVLHTASEEEDTHETLKAMRAHGVRRVPVVSEVGVLVGIVTLDDLLDLVGEELGDIVRAIGNEQSREGSRRR
jgi:CBS domain-containing protein